MNRTNTRKAWIAGFTNAIFRKKVANPYNLYLDSHLYWQWFDGNAVGEVLIRKLKKKVA